MLALINCHFCHSKKKLLANFHKKMILCNLSKLQFFWQPVFILPNIQSSVVYFVNSHLSVAKSSMFYLLFLQNKKIALSVAKKMHLLLPLLWCAIEVSGKLHLPNPTSEIDDFIMFEPVSTNVSFWRNRVGLSIPDFITDRNSSCHVSLPQETSLLQSQKRL